MTIRTYKTWLPECDCGNGVLVKDGSLYCRWCRKPYGEGAAIDYRDEYFVEKGKRAINEYTDENMIELSDLVTIFEQHKMLSMVRQWINHQLFDNLNSVEVQEIYHEILHKIDEMESEIEPWER